MAKTEVVWRAVEHDGKIVVGTATISKTDKRTKVIECEMWYELFHFRTHINDIEVFATREEALRHLAAEMEIEIEDSDARVRLLSYLLCQAESMASEPK